MAIFELPKQFHPDFAIPGVNPKSPVVVDYSNPLSTGLHIAMLPGSGLKDIVTGERGAATNATDTGKDFVLSNGRVEMVTGRPAPADITVMTCVSYNSSAQDHTLFDVDNQDVLAWADTSSGALRIGLLGAGRAVYGSSIDAFTAGTFGVWGAQFSQSVDDGWYYLNGTLSGPFDLNIWSTFDTVSLFGNYGSTGKASNANYRWVFVWDRLLTQIEMQAVERDPFQMFKPAMPMVYQYTVSTGGTTYEVSATFAATSGITVASNAVFDASASFSATSTMSGGKVADAVADAQYAAVNAASMTAIQNAETTANFAIVSGFVADPTADIGASVSFVSDVSVSAVSGLDISAAAAFAVTSAIVSNSDISIEGFATFATVSSFVASAVADIEGSASFQVVAQAIAENQAILEANMAVGTVSELTVSRSIVTNASVTISIVSGMSADGSIGITVDVVTPDNRKIAISAASRSVTISTSSTTTISASSRKFTI